MIWPAGSSHPSPAEAIPPPQGGFTILSPVTLPFTGPSQMLLNLLLPHHDAQASIPLQNVLQAGLQAASLYSYRPQWVTDLPPRSLPLSILPTPGHIKSKRLSCAQNHRLWCAWGPKGLSVYQISSEREGESVCACVCVCVCMRLCVCACVCRRTVSTGSWEAP